jgi:glycerophosphoryl diester phosphodiesterase
VASRFPTVSKRISISNWFRDIRLTADNRVIIMHDLTLDRTTTGFGLVSDHDLSYIETLFSKGKDGKDSEHRIPLVVDVLELMLGQEGKTLVLDM